MKEVLICRRAYGRAYACVHVHAYACTYACVWDRSFSGSTFSGSDFFRIRLFRVGPFLERTFSRSDFSGSDFFRSGLFPDWTFSGSDFFCSRHFPDRTFPHQVVNLSLPKHLHTCWEKSMQMVYTIIRFALLHLTSFCSSVAT